MLPDLENRWKEEADHFDMQNPITIQAGDKEKIGKIETGHHKMRVSAIYNIRSFKFNDWEDLTQTSLPVRFINHFKILRFTFKIFLLISLPINFQKRSTFCVATYYVGDKWM